MPTSDKVAPQLLELKTRLTEINDIESAAALLSWDQATYMPPGGAPARGRQLATLNQIAHTKLTDGYLGELLENLHPYETQLPPEHPDASLIRVTRRNYQRAVQIPARLMAVFSHHRANSYVAWAAARANHDFAGVQPYLEKTLELSRDLAACFPDHAHLADPLIDAADPGMTVTTVRSLFSQLRQRLVPWVEAIAAQPLADTGCLHQSYPVDQQLAFSHKVLSHLGYDLHRGRQDQTLHPFMTKFSLGDVRITTRVQSHNLSEALFSTIHEMGHALYEQGITADFEGTPLAEGASSGVHESQSRLWENLVGRSRPFWEFFYPQLQTIFPQQLGAVSLETFYRAINQVRRSLIRTDADEVTYNLHVMIRFDLEVALLEGSLAVSDLPAAWNERYRTDLGLVPETDQEGILQDVHWYCGTIGGMFQGYTLGNLMSAQFFEALLTAHPEVPAQMQQGDFQPIREWLRLQIHQHGCTYRPLELVEHVTGTSLSIEPFLRYLQQKYGELYAI
ncbi:carboxypeptidase [Neosynechococcus sphagnicola sy1]|uniref:Metal-dependent carboxypeptidase n=2 Tax=Neosynechococcus TaxID=1501143 RepID=A0A098TL07_9CYAN|nr:carboxypeptidase [Neosynechococcus sphagnicola sy1]